MHLRTMVKLYENRPPKYRKTTHLQQIQPLHSKYGMAKDGERRSVYSVLVSLQCFLSAHEYATLHNRLLKLCHQLSKQLTSLPMECVMELLGLPDDWYVKSKKFSY